MKVDAADFNGENSMINTQTYISTGKEMSTALTDNNGTGFNQFTFKEFNAQEFGIGIS